MTLSYDPLLRLHETNGSGLLRYVYDGTDLIAEHNGANNILYEYVHGPGADEPVFKYYYHQGIAYPMWFHPDERGSIHLVTRNSAYQTLGSNTLDEYGAMGYYNWGRFQFTGQAWLPDIFLYNYKSRVYHPGGQGGGRFLQTDPTGYADGPNWYSYAQSDPINLVDSHGRAAKWIQDKASGSVVLQIPVYFHGQGADPAAVAAIERRVESLSIDKSSYSIDLMVLTRPGGKGANSLSLNPGLDQNLCGNVGECINRLGGDRGHIDSSKADYTDAAAHDILHFAGIKDRYKGGKADKDGNRSPSYPSQGYTADNIMSDRGGTQLKGRQFDEAKRRSSVQKCTAIGTKIASPC